MIVTQPVVSGGSVGPSTPSIVQQPHLSIVTS